MIVDGFFLFIFFLNFGKLWVGNIDRMCVLTLLTEEAFQVFSFAKARGFCICQISTFLGMGYSKGNSKLTYSFVWVVTFLSHEDSFISKAALMQSTE